MTPKANQDTGIEKKWDTDIRHHWEYYPTLFMVTQMQKATFLQRLRVNFSLSIYSYNSPTLTKVGGMIGGIIAISI